MSLKGKSLETPGIEVFVSLSAPVSDLIIRSLYVVKEGTGQTARYSYEEHAPFLRIAVSAANMNVVDKIGTRELTGWGIVFTRDVILLQLTRSNSSACPTVVIASLWLNGYKMPILICIYLTK